MKKTIILFVILLSTNFVFAQPPDNTKTITVKINGTAGVDCDYAGNRAIQDAIESISDA